MKKLFFSLLALIATLSVNAQDLAAGDYYLRNVESGKYVAWGHNWGSRSVLTEHGALLRVSLNNGAYTLGTQCGGNYDKAIRPTDGFADQSGTWALEDAGDGQYRIKGANGYYRYDGTSVPVVNGTSGQTGLLWEFLSKNQLTEKMSEATLENPVDATHFIKSPDFLAKEYSITNQSAWGVNIAYNNGQPTFKGEVGSNNEIINNTNLEIWNNVSTDKIKQTLTGLPKGTYKLSFFGLYRDGGPTDAATKRTNGEEVLRGIVYADDVEVSVMSIFEFAGAHGIAGTSTTYGNVPNSNGQAALHFAAGDYLNTLYFNIAEDNGSITIGIKKSSKSDNDWFVVDNFDLKYYGDNCTVEEAKNVEIVKEWNAYVAGYDAKATTLDAAGQSSYNTAKAAIVTPTSAAALVTAKETLAAAYIAAIKAQTTPGLDWTEVMVNADFEMGDLTGWTSADGGNIAGNTNYNTSKFVERWKNGVGLGNGSLTHDAITLPAGLYTLKIDAQNIEQYNNSVGGTGLFLRAAGEEVEIGARGIYSMLVKLTEETSVTIAVVQDNCTGNWVCYDNFQIIYEGQDFPALTAATGNMNATIAQAQTDAIAAFEADKTVANYNAALAAIAAAQTSVDKYAAAAIALSNQKALIDGTNIYAAGWLTGFVTNYNSLKEKYDNNTLNEEAVVNPNAFTAWHGSVAYNDLLTPWTLDGNAVSEWNQGDNLHMNTWSTEGDNDGSNFQVPFIESWTGDANGLTDKVIATQVTDLPNGLYSVSALVRTRAKDGVAYAEATGINLTVNSGTPVDVTKGTQINEGNRAQFGLDTFVAEGLVKDGILNITFDINNTNISWLSFKNVKYTKVRDLTPEEQIVYATEDEIAAFNEAIAAAEAKTLGFMKDEYAPYNNVEALAALKAAKALDVENPIDIEVLTPVKEALDNATWTANTEEVNAVYDGGFSKTTAQSGGYLVPTGWTNLGYNTRVYNQTNKGSNNGVDAGSEGGCLFAKFTTTYGEVEGYEMPLKAGSYTLNFIYGGWNETGTRDIKVYSAADNSVAATVTPNSVTAKSNQAHVSTDAWTSYDGIITIPSDGNYVLSFYRSGNTQNQIAISDLAIFSISEAELAKRDLLPEIENYVVPTTNIGDAAFQYPTAGIQAVQATIDAAQAVYDNADATLEQVNEAIQNMKNLTNPALNEPAVGQKFNVVLTYADYAHDNKAITYIANGRNDAGNYNIQYLAEASANYAQAFTMTKVEDKNLYKMSQVDNDGVERYVSTGSPYGGDNRQIRTTTNVDDALVVEVIPTTTEGVYNLKNTFATGDNIYLGSQDAGVYTVNSHYDFKLAEATMATANLKVKAASKYGTFIAPFDVDIPKGVTAYSAAVEGNVVKLTQLDGENIIPANTPCVLYSTNDVDVNDNVEGWGLATKDEYTEGALTGFYKETDIDANTGKYVLQNGAFYLVNVEGGKVSANRCYLTAGSGARTISIETDETAINAIDALTSGKAEIYDLNGRKLNRLQKGINIVNGTKIIVK